MKNNILKVKILFLFFTILCSTLSFAQLSSGVLVSNVGTSNTIGDASTSKNVSVNSSGVIGVVFVGSSGVRFAKSTNRGASFTASVQLTTTTTGDCGVNMADNGTIYVAHNNVLYVSTNGGSSFSSNTVGFGSTPLIASYGSNVYIINSGSNTVYRNSSNGSGSFSTSSAGSGFFAFSDIFADPLNGNVYVAGDNPVLYLYKSTNSGVSFSSLSPSGALYYSSYALSSGSLGSYIIAGSYDPSALKMNTSNGTTTSLTFTGNSASTSGRSVAAEDLGDVVEGYDLGTSVSFKVSQNLGASFGSAITITSASSLNIAINTTTQDVVVAYESSGQIYLNVYNGLLLSRAAMVTSGTLNAFTSCSGTASAQQSFSVGGTGLSANILVTPPAGYEVSTTSGSGFASSVTLTQSSGTVSATTVYVRLTNAATGTPSGNIACTSTGVTTQNVAASGTVTAAPTATAGGSQTICSNSTATVSGATKSNGNISWSENGAGSITSGATTLTPTYTAQSGDGGNAVTLTMTVTGTGTCSAQTATATYTVAVISAIANNTIGTQQSFCTSGTPASLTGSTPTGGNSSYTYLWQSSTTSATSGFSSALNTNTLINYQPTLLTQTNWFRRVVSTGSCSADTSLAIRIFVGDTTKPIVVTKPKTIYLNANGNASIILSDIENGSTDNCGIATRTLSKTAFNCSNAGLNTVYLVVTDNYGNKDSAAAIVTVQDLIKPTVVTQDVTLFLDGSGNGTLLATSIDNGSTDNCTISTRVLSKSTFNCSNVGLNTIYLKVTDASGNLDSMSASINVRDTIKPIVLTKNITLQLDITGNATLLPGQVDNGSSDACNFTLSVLPNTFSCAQVGSNTVILTIRDASNNVRSMAATVIVQDTIRPVVITRNINAYLNASGSTGLITAAQVNNGTSDACVITSLLISPSVFNCSQVGPNTVTLTATDYNNNVKSGTAIVTVLDTLKPTAIARNINAYLNASGTVSITGAQVNNNSTDNCSITTLAVSPSTFACANIGNNTVTLTATDASGNFNTTTAIVTVLDTIKPTVITSNITAYLGSNGTYTLTGAQVNNGSTDNCSINTISVSPSTFTCSNLGANTVTLTVTDLSGNFRTGTALVTVADTVRPVVITQNLTVQLNASGTASISATQINNGSNDACGIATVSASPTSFTCANTGANTVTLTVTDVNGNIKTGTAIVTVADTIKPNVIARNLTVYLGATGTITLQGSQVNGGSTDNCGVATYAVVPSTFNCSRIGNNNVVLTVTDTKGNTNTASAVITVLDTVTPTVRTRNISAILSATGTVSITAAQVNNGSSDSCGIATIAVSPSSFTCANIGNNTVTLTVTDVNGNIRTGNATVTVTDTIAPIVITQNRRLYLAVNGSVAVTPALIDNGSTDFCGIASMTVTPNILRCANVGLNTVTLSVTDLGGNVRTGTAVVTIFDTIKPTVSTRNISVYLNSAGTASIVGSQINNGSLDACGIANYSANPSTFTCANTGANAVVLTVTDVNGNAGTRTATVTVIDTVRPNVITKDINAYLGANGSITVLGFQVDNGSTDSCGIATYAVSPNTFTCSNLGTNAVVLTVTDTKGNFKTGTATITVLDTVKPVVVTQNITVQLSSLGAASITAAQVNNGSTDACGIATTTVSPNSFTCTNVGNNTVTLTVTDVNGNIKTGTAIVTVQDTVRPVVNTQNITVQLNSLGAASITAAQVNNGSTDICGIATLAVSPNTFNCSNTGNNTVTLTVTDVNGNVKTGTAVVTVADTIKPVVVTQNITVQLSNLGAASITAAQVNNGSSDACGIATTTVSPNTFTCSNIGTNTVTLTVTDNKGNVNTGTAIVTIQDTVRPVVVTRNITVQLNTLGAASITAAQVNNGSTDACGIATTTVSPNTFNCSNTGNNTVTLTVTDVNGNVKTGTAVVTVADTIKPVVVTQNITVQLSNLGAASITAAQVNNGSSDACGIATTTVSPNAFTCSNVGTNTVTLTVTDNKGNVNTGTAIVTVADTVRPVVVTRNITVQLNSLGAASITAAQVNNGSTDACGISTLAVSPNTFSCSNVGTNTVTLTVTDVNGNVKTGTAVVTIQDTIKPVVLTQNITTYIGTNGTVSITAAQINNGSSDACGVATVTVSPSVITCADLGIKTVTLTVTDVNGNVNTATSTVIVLDPIAPVARPKARFNAYLSINGQVIINAGLLDSASTDNCTITSRVLSQSVFNCSNIGINNILFTVQDQSGNSHSATVAVNILDTIAPNAIVSNQSIYLNAAGTGSITAAQVNNNSTDNCGVASFAISKSNYNCLDLGSNNTIFTVTDVNSNVRTTNFVVNVFDTIRPSMRPKQNINVYIGATGTANILVSDVDSASTDNCSIATKTLSQTAFTCANVGVNTITLSGTDATGNIGSRTFTATVLDTVRPLLTTRPASIYVNATGSASLTAAQVILSSSDNCSSGLLSSISQNNFSCANLGTNTVTVTVTDGSGNFRTINATVTVLDTIKPNVLTQNRTIYLNAVGTASLTAAQVNNGTTDNCTIQSLSISKTSYIAADLGINNITFTATDNSSNSQTVNVIVTVLDTVRPVVITQNRTIYLNASGTASVTAAQVNNGSSDNVGVTSLLLSRTAFSCTDLGANIVTLTVSDISNNSTSATAIITVLDTIRPVVVARNLTLYLNAIGQVSITPAQINNGSTDNCSIVTYALSKSAFNCTDRGINSNIITLSVTDGSGNTSTATANISVLDTIRPNIVVNNNLNIYLNASGVATLTTAQVNNGSNDNCGITTLALSKTSFNSTNLGLNIVSFTATDASGNNQSVNVNVNVLDSMMPVAIAQNKTIYLDSTGSASVTAAQVNNGSTDNVGVTSLTLSKTTFGCSNTGNNAVVLTVRDISNNVATANAIITVLDTIRPTVVAQNLTVYLNGIGLANITPAQANNGTIDNCSIANLSISKSSFNCTDRGINSNTLTLTATDASGNTSNTSFTVSVLDTFKPNVVVNNNLNIYLNASGTATIATTQVNNGSTDNCGITTLALSKTSFNGTNLGLNVVSFTATDASGNSSSVNLNVIVNDTIAPIIIARNKTLYLDASGSVVLTANDVDNGSTDNVGITTKTVNKTLFNCNDAGLNLVEFIVGDVSGNKSSVIVTVTVLDTILPIVSNVPANIALGYCKADYIPNMPTATDNCGGVTIKQIAGITNGNKYPIGVTTNTFTFEDKSGNKVTRSYTVTIYPKYVPDTISNRTVCSSVPSFNLTPANAKGIYTFKGSGVTLDGKMFDPSLSGSGNYNVTYVFIDSMSCVTEGNFFITVNRAPDKPVIDRKTSTVLQVQQQFPFYQWLRYGQPIAGATSQSYNTTRSGLYSVQVSSKEGCSTESDAYAIGSVGVNNSNTQIGFKLYPNPSNGMINIELDDQNVTETSVKVFDALGKLVYETEFNTFITQLDLSNIADGTYFVRLTQAGKTTVKPIVITK